MNVLERLATRYGDRVEISVFGLDPSHPDASRLDRPFSHNRAGTMDGWELARLFNDAHVFADFSTYQAMGLSALEAMACGATAIVPAAGGARSFARDGENALVIDTSNEEACLEALVQLVEDRALLARLMERAFRDALAFHPLGPAVRTLEALFPAPPVSD